jgi:hypothetical protein
MRNDKPKKDQTSKPPAPQGKGPGDQKSQLQEEPLKVHGDKLEHPKSK